MSKLEDLVPSLELCKRIPAGAFADSALVWFGHDKVYFPPPVHNDMAVVPRHELGVTCHVFLKKGVRQLYPAPTLEEILKMDPIVLRDFSAYENNANIALYMLLIKIKNARLRASTTPGARPGTKTGTID